MWAEAYLYAPIAILKILIQHVNALLALIALTPTHQLLADNAYAIQAISSILEAALNALVIADFAQA